MGGDVAGREDSSGESRFDGRVVLKSSEVIGVVVVSTVRSRIGVSVGSSTVAKRGAKGVNILG